MKKYTKEDLLLLLEDNNNFHKEIKETKGYILFLMKKHSIDVNPDELLVPHMSAWCIPYLSEKFSSLSDEQQNILNQIAKGKNYWVRNKLINYKLDIQPFTERFTIDDMVINRVKDVNEENLENKINIYRLSKSIQFSPIKSKGELIDALNKLNHIFIVMKKERYTEGIDNLVDQIYQATQEGSYQITQEDISDLPTAWINSFSLKLFNNVDSTIRRLEKNFDNFIEQYKNISKLDLCVQDKYKMYSKIGLMDNLSIDTSEIIYELGKERESLNKDYLNRVILKFIKSERGLVENNFKIVDSFFDYGLIKLQEEEYVGYHHYINLNTMNRALDENAWLKYMKNNNIEKLPLSYLWSIGKAIDSDSFTINKNFENFLENNVAWSDFYKEPSMLSFIEDISNLEAINNVTKILWNLYDNSMLNKTSKSDDLFNIIYHIYNKVRKLDRYSDEENLHSFVNYMNFNAESRNLKFIHLEKLAHDEEKEKLFLNSIYLLNADNIEKLAHMDFTDKEWGVIFTFNEKFNPNFHTISKNLNLIPNHIFNIFIDYQQSSGNEVLQDYCENYVVKNWSNLNLDIMKNIKSKRYLSSANTDSLEIDINEKYDTVYSVSRLNEKYSFNFSLTTKEAIQKINTIKLMSNDDFFSHLKFISLTIYDNHENIFNFIDYVSNLNLSVNQFDEVLENCVFNKLQTSYLDLFKEYSSIYLKKYSTEDYYKFIFNNSKSHMIEYNDKSNCLDYLESLKVDIRKLFDLLPFVPFVNLLLKGNKDISEFLDIEFMKKITDSLSKVDNLKFHRISNIFENIFDKKIEKIKSDNSDNVEVIASEIKSLYINKLKELESEPLIYLLFISSSKSMLMEAWKYDKDDNSNIRSEEFSHQLFNENVNIDIFNSGISELKKKIRHFDYHHTELGSLLDINSSNNEEFDTLFRRIYSLTWASCKTNNYNYDYENKSLMNIENKDKIWSYIEENFPYFFINMDACNVSTVGFDDVQIKNWLPIFDMLSMNCVSDSNYRNVEKKNTEMLIDSFLNYDANDNFEILEYIQNLIFMTKNSQLIEYDDNYEAKYKFIDEKTPPVEGWYEVKLLKDSLLLKNLMINDLRVKEINALYEYSYLNDAVESNVATKINVFKV